MKQTAIKFAQRKVTSLYSLKHEKVVSIQPIKDMLETGGISSFDTMFDRMEKEFPMKRIAVLRELMADELIISTTADEIEVKRPDCLDKLLSEDQPAISAVRDNVIVFPKSILNLFFQDGGSLSPVLELPVSPPVVPVVAFVVPPQPVIAVVPPQPAVQYQLEPPPKLKPLNQSPRKQELKQELPKEEPKTEPNRYTTNSPQPARAEPESKRIKRKFEQDNRRISKTKTKDNNKPKNNNNNKPFAIVVSRHLKGFLIVITEDDPVVVATGELGYYEWETVTNHPIAPLLEHLISASNKNKIIGFSRKYFVTPEVVKLILSKQRWSHPRIQPVQKRNKRLLEIAGSTYQVWIYRRVANDGLVVSNRWLMNLAKIPAEDYDSFSWLCGSRYSPAALEGVILLQNMLVSKLAQLNENCTFVLAYNRKKNTFLSESDFCKEIQFKLVSEDLYCTETLSS